MVLDPGHFHAALLQQEMLPGVSGTVHIYAPLGPDLNSHLARIAAFNNRPEHPTNWISRIYAGPDYSARMMAERPGNVVILSGRNLGKIDAVQQALGAGMHVLADKPWVIEPADLPKLEAALRTARETKLAAYDIMTQRYEITSIVLRELVRDPEVFGRLEAGTQQDPAVSIESVHHLLKVVLGQPNVRPAWFFDIRQQGEGLADIGTHLADLVQWTVAPDRPIDWRKDIQVLAATRWPTVLSLAEFGRVTGERRFPAFLESAVRAGALEYFCNNTVDYTLQGVHTHLLVRWAFEAPAGGGDTELAVYRGSKSRVESRQGAEEKYRPEVYIIPNREADPAAIEQAVTRRLRMLESAYPGMECRNLGSRLQILIPDGLRDTHEKHFALVARKFLKYVRDPGSMPSWEEPNMLAKYYLTTKGVELARAAGRKETR